MGRPKKEVAPRQPMELGALKKVVDEFMERYERTDHELDLLKEDQKNLKEEFSDRLDLKTLNQAIRVIKIKKKVEHKTTYDSFVEILDKRENI